MVETEPVEEKLRMETQVELSRRRAGTTPKVWKAELTAHTSEAEKVTRKKEVVGSA